MVPRGLRILGYAILLVLLLNAGVEAGNRYFNKPDPNLPYRTHPCYAEVVESYRRELERLGKQNTREAKKFIASLEDTCRDIAKSDEMLRGRYWEK